MLVVAIHVKDSICTAQTNFVLKLSKLNNNQVLNVTNLYSQLDVDAGL